jgi:sugar transferase EpsL
MCLKRKVPIVKRLFDFMVALILITVTLPIILITGILVRIKLGHPVIFKQQRPGKYGNPFYFYKFRSMTDDRDANGELLSNDMRLTSFGQVMRRFSLDELPQLFNVLKGDISLVGPRPLLMDYLELYTPEQSRRHEVLPGITGLAQVNGRNAISWEDKFKLDVWYVDNQSFWLDIKIILLTVSKVFKAEGVNQKGRLTVERYKGTKEQ